MITGFAADFGMPGATFGVLATNGTDPCRAFLVEGRTPKTSYRLGNETSLLDENGKVIVHVSTGR